MSDHPSPPRPRRWLPWAWALWGVATAAWLAAVAWAERKPAHWPADPAAWFSGDESWRRPFWPMEVRLHTGADVANILGNPTFRVPPLGGASLGRWPVLTETFTWSFWALLPTNTADGKLPDYLFAQARGPRYRLELRLRDGDVLAQQTSLDLRSVSTDGGISLRSPSVPTGRWTQMCMVKEPFNFRLYLDGQAVMDKAIHTDFQLPYLADFQLAYGRDEGSRSFDHGNSDPGTFALYDDVAIFDRALSEPEVAALAGTRRGELPLLMQGAANARRVWQLGWLWAALLLAGLAVASLSHAAAAVVRSVWEALPRPAYRPVWLVLLVGGLGTALVSAALARTARRNDQARFDQAIYDFGQATDTYFERIADMLGRARDWIAAQPELSPAAWERWCKSNNFPYDISGLIGLGYAEQLLPAGRAAHEARWAARYGFPYRVGPDIPSGEAWRPRRLRGEPRLPVVLYQPDHLDAPAWRTNGTILGRDLLAMRLGDPRVWGEPERIEEAIGDGGIQSSGLEEVAPAGWYGEAVQGLRLYAPLVAEERRQPDDLIAPELWRGVVFASVDPRRWLEPLGDSAKQLGFRIHTAGGAGEILQLVADSGEFLPGTGWRAGAQLTAEEKRPHYGYRLAITFWTTPAFEAQSQRRWPWAAAGVGGGFTLLTAGLLFVQVRGREKEAVGAERLRAANAELARVKSERERLSRDLHDGTIQNLYALGLHLQHAQRHLTETESKAAHGLEEGQRLVQDTIVELREFLLSLKEEPPHRRTFTQVLEDLLARLRRTTRVEFSMVVAPAADALPARMVVHLVNVAREALSNAVRHGQPDHIVVELQPLGTPGAFRLEIRDDGRGFDPAETNSGGFGLLNMRERAAELTGAFTVESAPGHGTRVRVEFAITQP